MHNYDGKMLFNKDKLNKEIQNGICVITLPKKINEYETTLVLIKLIQGGVRSISINLYLNSLLNVSIAIYIKYYCFRQYTIQSI